MVLDALATSYERWDGKGFPGELSGQAIPVSTRIVQLAEFIEVAHRTAGIPCAIDVAERRSGKQFDPTLVAAFTTDVEKVFNGIDELGSWDAVLDGEPSLRMTLSPAETDSALAAVARFVDLKSPYTLGHSQALAELASQAGQQLGMPPGEVQALFHAGLVTGFGRLGVSNAVWDKPAPLTAGDWERVRLHPHLTERMLHQSEALAPLGRIAVQHRERLDGSGYPRGLTGPAISRSGRVLGAADAYLAMREPRPYRDALTADEAAGELRAEVARRSDGRACRRRRAARRRPSNRPTAQGPGGVHCPRGRGAAAPDHRALEQADRPAPCHHAEDCRQSHRAHLHQDRRHQSGGSQPLRDAARPPPEESFSG